MSKYDVYVAGDCIAEHDDYEKARRDFYEAVRENPDYDTDVLSEDGETSLLAYDSNTKQVYDYSYRK